MSVNWILAWCILDTVLLMLCVCLIVSRGRAIQCLIEELRATGNELDGVRTGSKIAIQRLNEVIETERRERTQEIMDS